MTLPEFTKPMTFSNDYDGNVAEYGTPPKGYRFRKAGEKYDRKTDLWAAGGRAWKTLDNYDDRGEGAVRERNWPVIARIVDDCEDALVLEEVSRNAKNVHFRITKQLRTKVSFKATNGLSLFAGSFPAVYSDSFYVRGREKQFDDKVLFCSLKKFAQITEAVREYNASLRPKPAPKATPAPTPIEQIKTLLSAHPEIAAEVMGLCVKTLAKG